MFLRKVRRAGDWPKVTELGRSNTRPRIQASSSKSLRTEQNPAVGEETALFLLLPY